MERSWTRRPTHDGLSVLAKLAGASLLALSPLVAGAASLQESVERAIAFNPEVGIVQADRQAIDQELTQARALYFPSLDVRAAIGPEFTNSPATRNDPEDGSASTLLRLESQLTLTQQLFAGFARKSEIERQLARVDSASRRVEEAAEFIGLDAIEAHLNVLRNEALVDLAASNVEAHERILAQVRQLERSGGGSIADVRQAEARRAAAENALASATGSLRDARAAYVSIVGDRPRDLERPAPPLAAVPESPEAAAARASLGSPTVKIAASDTEVAKAELLGARSGFYPSLDIEAGVGANDNLDGIRGSDIDAQALLVLRYNIFAGGADVAREREAFERVYEAREVVRDARRAAEEDARISYNALTTARDQVRTLRDQTEATRATRDAYGQQFDLGQRSLLDLLDSENELFISRSNLVTAEFTELFAIYRVLAVTGDLLITMDVDAPRQAININRERQPPLQEGPSPAPVSGATASAAAPDRQIAPAGFIKHRRDDRSSWGGLGGGLSVSAEGLGAD